VLETLLKNVQNIKFQKTFIGFSRLQSLEYYNKFW